MERLTYRDEENKAFYYMCQSCPLPEDAYKAGVVGGPCHGCIEERINREKLADYEDAEEQGQLIKIPAHYKDNIFILETIPYPHINQLEFYGMELTAIGAEDESRYIIAGKNGCTEYFDTTYIGETIFFSLEEAETKLKEMEDGEDAKNHESK